MTPIEVFRRLFRLPCYSVRSQWPIDPEGPEWSLKQIREALAPLRIKVVRAATGGYDWSAAIGLTGRIGDLISVYRNRIRVEMLLDTPREFSGRMFTSLGSVLLIEDPAKADAFTAVEPGWILAVPDFDAEVQRPN